MNKKRVLIISLAAACILLLAVILIVVVSCSSDDNPSSESGNSAVSSDNGSGENKPSVGTKESGFTFLASGSVSVVSYGNTVTVFVPNDMKTMNLQRDYVMVSGGVSWIIAKDISMQQLIPNKIVSLDEGENRFYVYCYTADESVNETYEILIHRKGSFTVTFEGIDEVQRVEEGKFAVQPVAKPTKIGYSFSKWNFDFTQPVSANVTVDAKWTPEEYLVRFDAYPGTVDQDTMLIKYDDTVVLPTPVRPGYIFAGWYVDEDITEKGEIIWKYPSEMTLKALWASGIYRITFNPAGGQLNGISTETVVEVTYGGTVTFPEPTREGYIFGGWFEGETLYELGTMAYEYTKDLNLTAKWNEHSATLTFVENGGSRKSYTETIAFGSPLPIPTREGYTFGGWFSDEKLTVEVKEVPDSSMKLFAWWTEEGKPGEFIYEAVGLQYNVIARVDRDSTSVVPAYIGGRMTKDSVPRPNANAGVKLETEDITVKIDRTGQIYATFLPYYEGDDVTLTYTSSRKEVATVDENGTVKGVKTGSCAITVKNEATGLSAVCYVYVEATKKNPEAGLKVENAYPEIALYETYTVSPNYIPEYDDDDTTLTVSVVAGEDLAVYIDGVLTPLAVGRCTLLVEDNYNHKLLINVDIVEKIENKNPGITLSENTLVLNEGAEKTVTAVFVPKYTCDDTAVEWSTEKEDIVKVEDGKITAMHEGVAKVTVSSVDKEYTAEITVTVRKPGLTVSETELVLNVGDSVAVTPVFVPTDPESDAVLVWTVDNAETVKVENGTVTALAVGNASITIADTNGEFSVTVSVSVRKPGLTVSETELVLNVGDSKEISAVLIPTEPTGDTTVVWTVDDASIIQAENGIITAIGEGSATATVSSLNGEYTASVSVTVRKPGLTVSETELVLNVGDSMTITAVLVPTDPAGDTAVVWTTDSEETVRVENGVITAVNKGSANITAASSDGIFTVVISVTVRQPGIFVEETVPTEMTVGDTLALTVSFVPEKAEDGSAPVYTSSAPAVATFDNGVISAVGEGVSTLIISSADGKFSVQYTLNVVSSGITPEPESPSQADNNSETEYDVE